MNLERRLVSPSLAWKLSAENSIGVALNIAHQRFSAQGIGVFGAFSTDPAT